MHGMPSISIRELTPADIPALRDITWRAWVSTYSRFIPQDDLRAYFAEHYSAGGLAALFSNPEYGGFIAADSSTAAGYCKTHSHRLEGRFYIPSLYVLPEYHSMGIGGLLLQAAQLAAAARGLHEVWLGVMADNTGALAWYRKRGFDFVREEPFTMGRTTVSHLIGFKKID